MWTSCQGKLIIIPVEAKLVKDMFRIYKETRSQTRVREHLSMVGAKNRSGKPFAKGTVEFILRNPIYAGKIFENGDHFDGVHDPIIDEKLFFALNKMEPKREHGRISKTDRIYLLKGLVRCGHHKCKMTPYWVKKKDKLFHYYQFTKYSQYKKLKCKVRNINADKLEKYVVERLAELAQDTNMFHSLVDQVNLYLENQKEPQKKELAEANRRIAELKNQLDNLIGAVEKSGRKTVTELFEKRIEKIQYELNELEK